MTMMPNVVQFQPHLSSPAAKAWRPAQVRRPRLLVEAARAGLPNYRRKRDLRRILRGEEIPQPGGALRRLLAEEDRLDQSRRDAEADYDVERHVFLLIAIMAESILALPHPAPSRQGPGPAPITFPGKASRAHL